MDDSISWPKVDFLEFDGAAGSTEFPSAIGRDDAVAVARGTVNDDAFTLRFTMNPRLAPPGGHLPSGRYLELVMNIGGVRDGGVINGRPPPASAVTMTGFWSSARIDTVVWVGVAYGEVHHVNIDLSTGVRQIRCFPLPGEPEKLTWFLFGTPAVVDGTVDLIGGGGESLGFCSFGHSGAHRGSGHATVVNPPRSKALSMGLLGLELDAEDAPIYLVPAPSWCRRVAVDLFEEEQAVVDVSVRYLDQAAAANAAKTALGRQLTITTSDLLLGDAALPTEVYEYEVDDSGVKSAGSVQAFHPTVGTVAGYGAASVGEMHEIWLMGEALQLSVWKIEEPVRTFVMRVRMRDRWVTAAGQGLSVEELREHLAKVQRITPDSPLLARVRALISRTT